MGDLLMNTEVIDMEVTNRTKDSISVKMSIVKYRCQNCGHEFLADEPHPCPTCKPDELEQWKQDRKEGKELPDNEALLPAEQESRLKGEGGKKGIGSIGEFAMEV